MPSRPLVTWELFLTSISDLVPKLKKDAVCYLFAQGHTCIFLLWVLFRSSSPFSAHFTASSWGWRRCCSDCYRNPEIEKSLLITFKALDGFVLKDIKDVGALCASVFAYINEYQWILAILRSQLINKCQWVIIIRAPKLWSGLSTEITTSLLPFKSLKTFF